MSRSRFYETYWKAHSPPPHSDPTIGERMARLERALRSIRSSEGPTGLDVLDAGCGDGIFITFLLSLGMRVSGVDLSSTACARGRERCPGVDIRVASLEERLPFGNGTFDAVWCTEVLEHIFDVHAALSELNRVLRTGGHVILTTPYHGLTKNLLVALTTFGAHFSPDGSHIRFFTRATLNRCLRRAGFTPTKWTGVGRAWPIWRSFFVVARKAGAPHPRPQIVG